jgi:hypothetical protein
MRSISMEPTDHRAAEKTSVFRRMGIYIPLLIIMGLAVPMLIYLGVMQATGWTPPVLGSNGALSSIAGTSSRISLYVSPSTKTYFTGIGGNYDTLLVPWRAYFSNRKLDFSEIQELAQLRKQKEGILILPSAVALSAEERASIAEFRSHGGAILTTWATGSRNGKGEWEGWQFLEQLGVKMTGEIPATAEVNNLILSGESPVSSTQPAGQRVWMSKTSETLLRFKGEMVAGRFMNWARITDNERRDEGAVIFSEASAGSARAVAYAFAESTWESHPLAVHSLIDDTLQWLRREPVAVRAAWPQAKRAAQVIEMDTEEGFANALTFAAMMQSLEYRATFYVLTSVAKVFPEVLAKLARDFEVGYHADIHIGFKGQTAAQQEKRIKTMRADLDAILLDTKGMTGFRAPTESYDATTEQLLHQYGIRHHAADPGRSEGRLPLLAKLEGVEPADDLIVLPRTQRDDINLFLEKLSVEQTTQALIDDFDLTLATGSLGLLSVHSQNFSTDSTLTQAMPGFLAHVKQQRGPVWLASAGQVSEWWRERERFKLASSYSGKRLELNVSVTGNRPLSGATLVVMLPQKGALMSVKSLKIGLPKPSIAKIDDFRAAIVFDTLQPGNYAYQATFSLK